MYFPRREFPGTSEDSMGTLGTYAQVRSVLVPSQGGTLNMLAGSMENLPRGDVGRRTNLADLSAEGRP